MSKPSIFFSHSSKDKDYVMAIKDRIDEGTGGVLDIFMSSDGQSIPFGTNWVHIIEDRLQTARIMFVFITVNSISSGWIYFEAGFAYSKGIRVIPIGVDVDIGSLKAPLNLLQGFNITSEDSLNNFIAIINKEFSYQLKNCFFHDDYSNLIKLLPSKAFNDSLLEKIVDKIECDFYEEKPSADGNKAGIDVERFYKDILKYFEDNNINYAKSENYDYDGSVCVVACGVKMLYRPKKVKNCDNSISFNDCARISFFVSPYNFCLSFSLLKRVLQLLGNNKRHYVRLHIKEKYSFPSNTEDASSVMLNHPEFEVDKEDVAGYMCHELGLGFYVFPYKQSGYNRALPEVVASIIFSIDEVLPENIIELINRLHSIGFISKTISN